MIIYRLSDLANLLGMTIPTVSIYIKSKFIPKPVYHTVTKTKEYWSSEQAIQIKQKFIEYGIIYRPWSKYIEVKDILKHYNLKFSTVRSQKIIGDFPLSVTIKGIHKKRYRAEEISQWYKSYKAMRTAWQKKEIDLAMFTTLINSS